MWTSDEENAWLIARISEYQKIQKARGQQIQTWLRKTAPEFLEAFPGHILRDPDALVKVFIFTVSYSKFPSLTDFSA